MRQLLLFPDPRPLLLQLGHDFFRHAPQCPGIYLMRDSADTVLYIGKAKNLKQRLAHYRVANPDRMPRRHLRLLRLVARIELQQLAEESEALAREAELLRTLRPRFNRAGTWTPPARLLGWRATPDGLDLALSATAEEGWIYPGLKGFRATLLRASLLRLMWCASHPELPVAAMPQGWFIGIRRERVSLGCAAHLASELSQQLAGLFEGATETFAEWIRQRTSRQQHPFERCAREQDLETIAELLAKG